MGLICLVVCEIVVVLVVCERTRVIFFIALRVVTCFRLSRCVLLLCCLYCFFLCFWFYFYVLMCYKIFVVMGMFMYYYCCCFWESSSVRERRLARFVVSAFVFVLVCLVCYFVGLVCLF